MLLVEKIKKNVFVIFVIRFNCYKKKIYVFKMNIFTSGNLLVAGHVIFDSLS